MDQVTRLNVPREIKVSSAAEAVDLLWRGQLPIRLDAPESAVTFDFRKFYDITAHSAMFEKSARGPVTVIFL